MPAGGRSISEVAKDFDLTETSVRQWVRQAEVDAGERDGLVGGVAPGEPVAAG
ncbi:transposase [Spongiactinospora rosea]|uniref:transposase n=1 Tax=Spongiactinospora rosea TaxID=2248750 RepID=UPI0011C0802B|nr:transposase [Spongiactinospora rosea]